MSDLAPVRVGDRERGEVDAQLRDALADGVLTLTEYDERAAQCWAARTRAELDEVVRDLPSAQPAAPVPAAGATSSHRVLAVMSESGLEAPLRPGQPVQAIAVMGTADVDLRREDLPAEVTVQATAVMGEVKVHVPPGTTVHLTGGAVMGERKAKVGPPVRGGSLVHVEARALMGSVKVDDRPRKGGLLPAVDHALRHGSVPVPWPRGGEVAPSQHSGHVVRHTGWSRVARRLVPLAVVGSVLFAGAQVVTAEDGASVFGSRKVPAMDGQQQVEVGVLFGSVEVVVPDGARVRTAGTMLFGSVDCEEACAGRGNGQEIVVRANGGFGSIEVVTQQEAREEEEDSG